MGKMTIRCKGCRCIPSEYSCYKEYNYCFPCLYRISHELLRKWKKDFLFFDILEELKEIDRQDVKLRAVN